MSGSELSCGSEVLRTFRDELLSEINSLKNSSTPDEWNI